VGWYWVLDSGPPFVPDVGTVFVGAVVVDVAEPGAVELAADDGHSDC
jgi:hypothetical protein